MNPPLDPFSDNMHHLLVMRIGAAGHDPGPDLDDLEEIGDDLAKELMGEYLVGDTWMLYVRIFWEGCVSEISTNLSYALMRSIR